MNNNSRKRKKNNKRRLPDKILGSKILMFVNIGVTSILTVYFAVVFLDLPVIGEMRDIWIETAMTTAEHHWLATKFFPMFVIDRVMDRQFVVDEDTISNPELLHPNSQKTGSGMLANAAPGADPAAGADEGEGDGAADDAESGPIRNAPWNPVKSSGSAGQNGMVVMPAQGGGINMFGEGSFYESEFVPSEDYVPPVRVGDKDEFGNTVIVADEKEDIIIVEVRKSNYVGRIIFVSDPSRVVVRDTGRKNVQGELIKTYVSQYNAIAGMNGNGFEDPEGHGRGGVITGWSVAGGKAWGIGSKSAYPSVGLTEDNILMVGTIKDFEKYNIRDLAQYGPTVIVDGKKLISGSGGYGLQPRTAIGQREDGTILMATFDGRQPGHSLGITAGEVADLFLQYGCMNAGLCDGDSSSIMMYDNKIIGKSSSPMKDTGRYIPNAFLVLRKSPVQETESLAHNEVAEAAPSARGAPTET